MNEQFLFNLTDQTIRWDIHIIGNMRIMGRLHDHVMSAEGIPRTITIAMGPGKLVEIPWTSIQTIERQEYA